MVHLVQLILNRLRHGAAGTGAAVGEYVGSGEVDVVGKAGCSAGGIIVVHVGLGLGLAVGILSKVCIHDGGGSSSGRVIVGAHPHVVENGGRGVVGRAGLELVAKGVLQVVVCLGLVGFVGFKLCCRLTRGAAACRGNRLCHLARSTALRADDGRFHARAPAKGTKLSVFQARHDDGWCRGSLMVEQLSSAVKVGIFGA